MWEGTFHQHGDNNNWWSDLFLMLCNANLSWRSQLFATVTLWCVLICWSRQSLPELGALTASWSTRPKDPEAQTIEEFVLILLLVSFPANEIRARLKEFGRTCLRKEFLRESEGSLQGRRSVPKLHCCSISHRGEPEKSHRWLVEMSGTVFTPPLGVLRLDTVGGGGWND